MGNEYEFIFLTPTEIDEKQLKNVFSELEDQIKAIKGKIVDREEMGRQQLAYEIEENDQANFWIWQLDLPVNFDPSPLNTYLNRSEEIIRYLLLRSLNGKGEE